MLITNQTAHDLVIKTNGHLTARIVDLSTGNHVGGSSGFQRMPLVRFTVAVDGTTRIPLVVGTASYVARLGYTIPPGRWVITTELTLGDEQTLLTPVQTFEVIP